MYAVYLTFSIKGIKKGDQQQLVDLLIVRLGMTKDTGSSIASSNVTHDLVLSTAKAGIGGGIIGGTVPTTGMKSSVNEAGAKLNEGLKRLATGFDLKNAAWLKGTSSVGSSNQKNK
jgi:hypothetical protein